MALDATAAAQVAAAIYDATHDANGAHQDRQVVVDYFTKYLTALFAGITAHATVSVAPGTFVGHNAGDPITGTGSGTIT